MREAIGPWAGPLLAALIAVVLGAVFFDQARMPDLFPWSGVVLPAALTGVLAIGLGLLMPDRLYYSEAERIALEFAENTGLSGAAAARILGHIYQARLLAGRLRQASGKMAENTAEATNAAAQDLEDIAARLMHEPERDGEATKLVTRAKLVVDAVDHFVAFKGDLGAQSTEVDAARTRIIESLTQMSEAADAVQTRLARTKLTDVEVATDVAEGLFGRPNT
ncbi:MAG: hypothetical protein AAF557_21035 [Pseudomonadota bacterium]